MSHGQGTIVARRDNKGALQWKLNRYRVRILRMIGDIEIVRFIDERNATLDFPAQPAQEARLVRRTWSRVGLVITWIGEC